MNEQLVRYGSVITTSVTPATVVFVAIVCLLALSVPRRYVLIPLLLSWFIIPLGQRVVIVGLNFMMFRVVILAAIFRALVIVRAKNRPQFHWNSMDTMFVLWGVSSVITFTLLYGEWDAFINHMGLLFNAFGVYFPLRVFYWTEADIDRAIKIFAVVCAVIAICMLNEQITKQNIFSVFGGVPQFTDIREGSLRSQGPFEHPILAGTFGATLVPLFLGIWWQKNGSKALALMGAISAAVIAVTSMSSTPIIALAAGVGALFLWPFRNQMRLIRWGIVLTLIGLQLVMKAPVWALIGRMDLVGGSSGYHRYFLVDQFIRRFGEWWLVGTRNSGSWGYDMWDTLNTYVNMGITGGLITFILFLGVLVCCFKGLGRARNAVEGNPAAARRLWAAGAALFSNMIAFLGIDYFDQTSLAWYALLAMISSLAVLALSQASTDTMSTKEESVIAILWKPRSSFAALPNNH